jgi:sulfate permease, SulP family
MLNGLFFAHKVSQLMAVRQSAEDDGATPVYAVTGQVLFAPAEAFEVEFELKEPQKRVRIDVHQAHFGEITVVFALDNVVIRLRQAGAFVELIRLNESERRADRPVRSPRQGTRFASGSALGERERRSGYTRAGC